MHWHRGQIAVASGALCLGLGGAAAALALSASASGPTPPSPHRVQVDSAYCNGSGTAGQAHGSCIFTLTDGRRFECPLRFSDHRLTPGSLERAKACHPLSPIRIPASWKPVFNRLYAIQACLARRGITARGGPYVMANPRRVPIGELDVASRPMAIIAFYTSAQVAQQAEPTVKSRVRRTGGSVQRHGAVSVVWMSQPSSQLAGSIGSCAFA